MSSAAAPPLKEGSAPGNEGGLAAAGKRAIRATAAFARESKGKSWWVVLSSIAFLALALVGTFPVWAWPFRLFSSLLAALLMVRVFVIYHDHQHRAILSKSVVAERLMNVVGVLLLAPPSSWKHSHDAHHAHNSKLHGNDLGSFPTMTCERFRSSSWKERLRYRVSRHPLTILCGYLTSFFFSMCLGPFIEDRKRHLDGLVSIVVHIALIASVGFFFGWTGVLFSIVLPFGVASALGSYLFYAQHNFPEVSLMDEDGWTYEGAALESSSFMQMPRVLHWFTGNIGYHHIHHLNARIPFYRLPEAYEALPDLQKAKRTSLAPKDVFRCIRLNVWSVEEQRLVGYGAVKDFSAQS